LSHNDHPYGKIGLDNCILLCHGSLTVTGSQLAKIHKLKVIDI